ncbi:MAG: GlsB/YeaQ/YmgE family stress response membrane protein [Bacteroidota bacterium]
MGIIAWIVFGLIAGAIAKYIMPGKDPEGLIVTVLIGIGGSVLGGFLGQRLLGIGGVDGFNLGSFMTAIVGGLLVLFIYRKLKSSK